MGWRNYVVIRIMWLYNIYIYIQCICPYEKQLQSSSFQDNTIVALRRIGARQQVHRILTGQTPAAIRFVCQKPKWFFFFQANLSCTFAFFCGQNGCFFTNCKTVVVLHDPEAKQREASPKLKYIWTNQPTTYIKSLD